MIMMSTAKRKTLHAEGGHGGSWVRLFDVSDPCRHNKKGHTSYKVTSTVFPRNSPEAATQLCVWRRFSDFKRLHKSLASMHAALHLGGTFPTFPRNRLFGRFEPEVIEERCQLFRQLLEFVAVHVPLFTSQTFVKFFESGKDGVSLDVASSSSSSSFVNDDGKDDLIMKPIKISQTGDHGETKSKSILDGVWLFGKAKKDQQEVSSSAEEDEANRDADDCSDSARSSGSSSLEKNVIDSNCGDLMLLSLFDPFCPSHRSRESLRTVDNVVTSSEWFASALAASDCATAAHSDQQELAINNATVNLLSFPKAFADFDDDRDADDETLVNRDNGGSAIAAVGRSALQEDIAAGQLTAIQVKTRPPKCFDNNDDGREVHEENDETKNCSSEDYLLDSAQLLRRAQESEIHGDYEAAFALYKTAIEILLTGAKEDLDFVRREAVKRKTAKYLRRAEEIYENNLKLPPQLPTSDRFDTTDVSDSHKRMLVRMSPVSDLGRYKVLGVIDKVLLVFDALSNITCVVKVIPKSSKYRENDADTVRYLPTALSHVVRLLDYHETRDSVFLVLSHATGGRLWSYIGGNIQNCGHGHVGCDACGIDEPFETKACNVYAGKKYLDEDEEGERVNIWAMMPPEDPALMDTEELVSKSRRLLKHVDVTLSQVTDRLPSNENSPIHNCRRHSGEVDGLEQQRVRGGGSLELHQTALRVRHFSSVFREMDRSSSGRRLPDTCVRVWAAEIAAALMDLHSVGVVCRDLNPCNVLLDDRGHVLLTYFAACLPDVDDVQLDVRAREAYYVAPEVLGIDRTTTTTSSLASGDWFSFGGLLFAMLTGRTLSSCHPGGLWSLATLNIPCSISVEAESVLRELLHLNPRERLGGGPEGDAAVRGHPFFADVDWDELRSTYVPNT